MSIFRNMQQPESGRLSDLPAFNELSEKAQQSILETYTRVYDANAAKGVKIASGIAYETAKVAIESVLNEASNVEIAKKHGYVIHDKTDDHVSLFHNGQKHHQIHVYPKTSSVVHYKDGVKTPIANGHLNGALSKIHRVTEDALEIQKTNLNTCDECGESHDAAELCPELAYALSPVMDDDSLMEDDTAYSATTHQQGSWKYQKRHALSSYRKHTTKDGREVWKRHQVLDNRVKPHMVKHYTENGYMGHKVNYGGLHNKPVLSTHISESKLKEGEADEFQGMNDQLVGVAENSTCNNCGVANKKKCSCKKSVKTESLVSSAAKYLTDLNNKMNESNLNEGMDNTSAYNYKEHPLHKLFKKAGFHLTYSNHSDGNNEHHYEKGVHPQGSEESKEASHSIVAHHHDQHVIKPVWSHTEKPRGHKFGRDAYKFVNGKGHQSLRSHLHELA